MGLLDLLRGRPAAAPATSSEQVRGVTSVPRTSVPRISAARTHKRRYAAARPDRLAGGFTTLAVARVAAETLKDDLRGLVAHSRHLAQNDDYMKAFLALTRRHVVGPRGIRLQNQARDPGGELDKRANDLIEEAWQRWSRIGNCTVCGRLSWLDVQKVAISMAGRDGNFLARIHRGRQYGPFGFQLQILDIDELDLEAARPLRDGAFIHGGIEYTALGRPIAYHFWNRSDVQPGFAGRERVRVPAGEIIHLYLPIEGKQMLGVPWAHTAARRLNMLGGYEEAALVAARGGASKMGFFTRAAEDEDTDEPPEDPEMEEFAPGQFDVLPPGYDFKGFDPDYPKGEMGPFVKLVLRGAAAGLGVAYSSLANDLEGANFSSLRAGLGEERDEWRTLQSWFAEHFCDQVFASWLEMALLSAEVPLPLSRFEKFNRPQWRARGWASVNPKDDSQANESDLGAGLRSPQDIVAGRGEDLEEVYQQIKDAKDLAASFGLEFEWKKPERPSAAGGEPAPGTPEE